MTEKEKLQAGELYNGNDRELVTDRTSVKKLCMEYNSATYNDFQKKERLLGRIIAFKGENTWIEPNFFCDYGYNIILGDNFYANHNLVILDCAEVIFGDNVFIGPNCGFYTAGHPLDYKTRNAGLEYAKPIKVGNNVWIGGNVSVMPGVTIGDNVVIGGGSVVTKDIPSGVVAVGNPCKPVKDITESTFLQEEEPQEEVPVIEEVKKPKVKHWTVEEINPDSKK
ncbi:MAG: sugar O-acetyltransferase [Ruminococcus sp.]|nr:sugar O-acetyltransferase [Ruminococcus sp.]MDE6848085.1 sugar O-acetyltransferase [Ruminococcus sp.]